MTQLFILAALVCPDTRVLMRKSMTWETEDQAALIQASKRCAEIYGPTVGCLVRFYKNGEREYQAVCGAKR